MDQRSTRYTQRAYSRGTRSLLSMGKSRPRHVAHYYRPESRGLARFHLSKDHIRSGPRHVCVWRSLRLRSKDSDCLEISRLHSPSDENPQSVVHSVERLLRWRKSHLRRIYFDESPQHNASHPLPPKSPQPSSGKLSIFRYRPSQANSARATNTSSCYPMR